MGLTLRGIVGLGLNIAASLTGQWYYFAAAAFVNARDAQVEGIKQRRRAQQAYNDAQRDRLEPYEQDPMVSRTFALGRLRAVEAVHRPFTSGPDSQTLVLPVSFAGHEIDAFEQFYLDGVPVTLDVDGWVLTAPYYRVENVAGERHGTLDGSGGAVVVLPSDLVPGTVTAVWGTGSGDSFNSGTIGVSVSGFTATLSGGPATADYYLYFTSGVAKKTVRIRSYLGTDGQNIGAALEADYPGKISAADRAAGVAMAIVECTFDPDVFTSGRPTPTALFRGAKVYDPRKDSTNGGSGAHRLADATTWEWSENSALLAYHYARHRNGWNVPATKIRTGDVIVAADACDVPTVFTLRKPDTTTSTVTLPRYRCGIQIATDADPIQAMESIAETMAGRVVWCGGEVRMRAGKMADPVLSIDKTWLAEDVGTNGETDGEPVISGVQGLTRTQRVNLVTGSCIDPDQRYQALPFPPVEDTVLIAAKGERRGEVQYDGVNHIAHAQHLASIAIREAQAGSRYELRCGLRALKAELLDVASITIDRFGMSEKTAEVIGWRWHPSQTIGLQLSEITAAIYTPDAELKGRDPAPDSGIRKPWDVEQITGVVVTSGTTPTIDGSVITRTVVTWDAAVGASIRNGGSIEVQYTEMTDTLPDGDWASWPEAGSSTRAVIPGLLCGRFYLFRVRAVQPMPFVRGAWSNPDVPHQIAVTRGATIYRQTTAPSSDVQDGDQWFDTDDSNKHYVREAGAWVSVRDGGIAQALSDAADAQATADGKIATFYQSSAPTAEGVGDIWFDTDDGNKQYRWSGSAWVVADDTRIGQAISDAADAQATADGKVTTFLATSAPTADATGDLWLDTDDGNKLYRWSGSAWVALPVGTGGIAPNATKEVFTTTPSSSVSVTKDSFLPDDFVRNTQVISVSFTPSADGEAVVYVDGFGSYTRATGTIGSARWSIQDDGAAWDSWKRVSQTIPASSSAIFPVASTRRFSVTAGVSYTFSLYACKLGSADTFSIEGHEMTAEVTYR